MEWAGRRLPLLLRDRNMYRKGIMQWVVAGKSLMGSLLMLILMTFNAWIILAVTLGTSLGYYRYAEEEESVDGDREPLIISQNHNLCP